MSEFFDYDFYGEYTELNKDLFDKNKYEDQQLIHAVKYYSYAYATDKYEIVLYATKPFSMMSIYSFEIYHGKFTNKKFCERETGFETIEKAYQAAILKCEDILEDEYYQ